MARPGPAEVLTIRQLSGGKRTDLKRAALSRFVRTRLDIVPRGRISALVPINALLGSEIACARAWRCCARAPIAGSPSQGRATIAAIVAGGRGRPAARRVTLAAIIISAPPVACHRSSFGSHGPSPLQSIVSVAQCIHAVRLSGFAYGCSFPSCLFRLCECVVKSRYADF